MEAILEFAQYPVVSLLSLLGTALGVVLTCVFYTKARRTKEPCWSARSIGLIDKRFGQFPDLSVLYRAEKVDSLTVTNVLFWNRGAETIHGSDIAARDPLRIVVSGAKVLEARVLQSNTSASAFSVATDADGAVLLGFDFLDRDHGAVIQLIHTGRSSDDVVLPGSIKGCGSVRKRRVVRSKRVSLRGPLDRLPVPLKLALVYDEGVYLGALGLLFSVVAFLFGAPKHVRPWLLVLLALIGVTAIGASIRLAGRAAYPTGLEAFDH